ncbi:Trifunctional nucleotide phosphoesterase protein YfkN precursor [Arthrobacter saudimassiliensis]|uniref:Trifunctional nucleotide phosphoesterase protein YfkN n=1 Tax=Arthrobacter saudimassiliensis TaxID=1461584 RepID=A0A078MTV7_9MICC|nr:Trifunctional nucleotide phosphoesterase protein YfkN precursor [Arthrobacter saudimassiliensis]
MSVPPPSGASADADVVPAPAFPIDAAATAVITVLGTTDLHGHVENWNYYQDAEYRDEAGNAVGLARLATLIRRIRAERGRGATLLIDAGDTIQGTPLTDYFASVEPITAGGGLHPLAAAMNAVGYDAAALGNHEFNYGLDLLRAFEAQLDFPLLGANAVDEATGEPAFPPYLLTTLHPAGAPPVRVGILGLTNPGVAVWDRAHVAGRLRFPGLVEQARRYVPELRAAGADLVLVSAHSGLDGASSYGDGAPPENAAAELAAEVPGIDAVLVGHAHREVEEHIVINRHTGRPVVLTEPLCFGMRLSVLTFDLVHEAVSRAGEGTGPDGPEPDVGRAGRWRVRSASARLLNANTADPDPEVSALIHEPHQRVRDYVNTPVGTAVAPLSAAEARLKPTPVMELVHRVQTGALSRALAGTADAGLPVLSAASPFSRRAVLPAGQVTIRDLAGLYLFPNTLSGVELSGAQLRDYLEHAARYFLRPGVGAVSDGAAADPVPDPAALDPAAPTNAEGIADYNFDAISGLEYDIDLARPVGERIRNLTHQGHPVRDGQRFALAVNNYRQSGSGNYPHVAGARLLAQTPLEIRQLLIEHVRAQGRLDPADYPASNWRLVYDGVPLVP